MSDIPGFLDELGTTRRKILTVLKNEIYASISRIAEVLEITHEAARKHVVDLQHAGWITADCSTDETEIMPGRPPVLYCLTLDGDHFFPKKYSDLSVRFLDLLREEGGASAVTAGLTRVTDGRVEALRPRVAGLPLEQKMNELRAIYIDDDQFTTVERKGRDFVLVEKNCPYLAFALQRPVFCSTTVSTLRRVTGHEVVREKRFQDGDGRCEFHVRVARPLSKKGLRRFEIEPEKSGR